VGVDDQGRIADEDLRGRVIKNEMATRAFRLTAARVMAEAKGNADPSAATSIMKNAGTWLAQERHELMLEIMGYRGLGWEGEEFEPLELETVRAWLYGKAYTIFGGSQEVQSNIVSKRILGLPDLTSSN
jgi:alkylation response protein AidB-like acyl-CoA dehydrogenase